MTVSDPLEEALPDVGFIELEDPETGGIVVFDTGGPEAAAFARAARAAVEAREALFKRLAMDPIDGAHRPELPAGADDVLRGARAEAAALRSRRTSLAALAALRRCCSRAWPRRARWASAASADAADARPRRRPSIPTRPPSRRASIAPTAHVGDPIRISVVTVAKSGVPVNLPGTSIWGRSRCSAATRRRSRTWATAASGASSS